MEHAFTHLYQIKSLRELRLTLYIFSRAYGGWTRIDHEEMATALGFSPSEHSPRRRS